MVTIHVTRLIGSCDCSDIREYLSENDLTRFDGMKTQWARERFLFTRKFVYQILAQELNLNFSEISFSVDEMGKPYLAQLETFFDFSISHSDQILAVGTSSASKIGVDVEDLKPANSSVQLSSIFSEKELRLLSLNEPCDLSKYWTMKESFMKLNGLGLSIDPREVEVIDVEHPRYVGSQELPYKEAFCQTTCPQAIAILSVALPSCKDGPITTKFY